jgi:hypothetical protein
VPHFDFSLPFNKELGELKLIPYRTNKQLKDKINYLFTHPKFEHRELFSNVSSSGSRGLLNDMSIVAVGAMRYFMAYPNQFANKVDNIHMQILVRMWKQTFKHCKMQYRELDKYYATKMKLLAIENGFIEELIRTCNQEDYIQRNDDMIKVRTTKSVITGETVGLRDRVSYGTHEGGDTFEYLCNLE